MTEDARFEDGREAPLYLGAQDAEDLKVLAALVQDAVFPVTEMAWLSRARRFSLLLNRFRWEDAPNAQRRNRPYERVQSVLTIDSVLKIASQGFDRRESDLVMSLLSVTFEPGEDGAGVVMLTLAGDGALRLEVEALDLTLRDVTRPYAALSGQAPDHGV